MKHLIRREIVQTFTYDPEAVDKAWEQGPALPDEVISGMEADDHEARAIAVLSAYADSLAGAELFYNEDFYVGYEVFTREDDA